MVCIFFRMSWLFVAIFGLLAAYWLQWRHKNRRLLAMAKKMPGPPPLPGLGNALKFMCRPEEFIRVIKDMMTEYGDLVRFWLGPDLNIIISDPDDIKTFLSSMKASVKGPQYKYMAVVLGGGILSGSGPTWRKHRKIATPNYGKQAIKGYSDIFNQEVELLLQKCRSKTSQQYDIYHDVVQTTSYSVCRTVMGLSKEQTMSLPHIQYIIEKSPRLYDIIFDRMTKWYLQIEPVFWLTKFYQQQKTFITRMKSFSETIIKHRLNHLEASEDHREMDLMTTEDDCSKNTQLSVVDRFILSKELDADELVKETFTIFTSSQEASAKISSFLLLMMAYHPHYQDKLYAEIRTIMGEEDRPVTDEDLQRMSYLKMVFKEVVRLFPIGALIQRTVSEDIVLRCGTLPAGSSLVVPIYYIHRDPRFWSNPEAFDPERFSAENTRSRHPYCYIPFSLGPMDCLGRYFGTKLIKTICVRVLREFRVTSSRTYNDLKLSIAVSAVSIDGYTMKLTPRKDK